MQKIYIALQQNFGMHKREVIFLFSLAWFLLFFTPVCSSGVIEDNEEDGTLNLQWDMPGETFIVKASLQRAIGEDNVLFLGMTTNRELSLPNPGSGFYWAVSSDNGRTWSDIVYYSLSGSSPGQDNDDEIPFMDFEIIQDMDTVVCLAHSAVSTSASAAQSQSYLASDNDFETGWTITYNDIAGQDEAAYYWEADLGSVHPISLIKIYLGPLVPWFASYHFEFSLDNMNWEEVSASITDRSEYLIRNFFEHQVIARYIRIVGETTNSLTQPGSHVILKEASFLSCDNDNDNDLIPNPDDNCQDYPNDQGDTDNDGIGNSCDNCPLNYNPGQEEAVSDPYAEQYEGTRIGEACYQADGQIADNYDLFEDGEHKVLDNAYYSIPDDALPGIIRIIGKNNVLLDCNGAVIDGKQTVEQMPHEYQGFGIYIEDSENITIKNCNIKHFFYGFAVRNSRRIFIESNKISENKAGNCVSADIRIDSGMNQDSQDRGGGIYFENVKDSSITNNFVGSMQNYLNPLTGFTTNQRNGIDLYGCSRINVSNNNASQVSGWGIHLRHTHNSIVMNNDASHIDEADICVWDDAGILLSGSHHNVIISNDLRYSGDGFFIGNNIEDASNHNDIISNDGSGSPHNAFEATFSDDNRFENNIASDSGYGFWLGFSSNTQVTGNTIENNEIAGIQIDNGHGNEIIGNLLRYNGIGVHLNREQGSSLASSNNRIYNNVIESNNLEGIRIAKTSDSEITGNTLNNRIDIKLMDDSYGCQIIENTFNSDTTYIDNSNTPFVVAEENTFSVEDPSIIEERIVDRHDNPLFGEVMLETYEPECGNGVCELSGSECPDDCPLFSTYSAKNLSLYQGKEVFIVSDHEPKDVLEFVPVTTWTDEYPDTIHSYPTLVVHSEGTGNTFPLGDGFYRNTSLS